MRNFKIILQYEGTRYQGWQRQESTGNTLQGRLEALLGKMAGTKVEVHGSGRTDAGVHALGQVADFKLETGKSAAEIMEYMNTYLPEDIAVIAIEEVPERFHSRLNARGKTYLYRVINSSIPHVFDRRFTWTVTEELDPDAMRRAARYLCGTHDFSAFTSHRNNKKSNVRTIYEIAIEKKEDEFSFLFYGNGFLYHMVRILTGTLLEVGMGKRMPEEMLFIIESCKRENAGMLVPAQGLTLVEVHYS